MFVLKHIIKTKIKNDKNSEKLSGNMGKDQFAENIVDSLLNERNY